MALPYTPEQERRKTETALRDLVIELAQRCGYAVDTTLVREMSIGGVADMADVLARNVEFHAQRTLDMVGWLRGYVATVRTPR